MSTQIEYDDDIFDDEEDGHSCPSCGGDGIVEYLDAPDSWGEDCPSEENHLVTCPNCKGSGLRKDCDSQ
jgi:DnaJ-class molecular chaperone